MKEKMPECFKKYTNAELKEIAQDCDDACQTFINELLKRGIITYGTPARKLEFIKVPKQAIRRGAVGDFK